MTNVQIMPSASSRLFPDGFVFGGATAAYQVEGECQSHGKGKVAWDDFLAQQGRFSPEPACDFYNRYDSDLALAEKYGMNGIRVSIAWSRIFPGGGGSANEEGVEFYHSLFASCKSHGIEPFVTLHHFDSPVEIYNNGDFLNRDNIDAFESYARYCFKEFPEVKHWFTFNEIAAATLNRYVEGTWPSGEKGCLHKCLQAQHNMMLAHARAVLAFDEAGHEGEIGVVHALEYKYPYDPESQADIAAARNDDVLQNRLLLDATFRGDYSAETLRIVNELCAASGGSIDIREEDLATMRRAAMSNDCLGVNYYQSRFLKAYEGESELRHNGTGDKGTGCWRVAGVGERAVRPGIPTTDWDWVIYPKGLFDLMMDIALRYPNYGKLYITENGMGRKDTLENGVVADQERIDYVREHLGWTLEAIECGVNVCGYFMWSLQDQFSWTNGYNKRYGFFYVDFETQKRYPKASAYWFSDVIKTNRL